MRLFLVRHAHSDPGDPDELRQLSSKGRRQARQLGERLAELEHEQWIEWSRTLAACESLSAERLARWHAHLTGAPAERVEIRVVGADGRGTVYPLPLAPAGPSTED